MTSLQKNFTEYEQVHFDRTNKLFHYVGVPMIMISLLGGLSHVVLWMKPDSILQLDVAVLMVILVGLRYLFLSFELGLSFLPILIGFYFLGRAIPMPALWSVFIVGWILQLVGHKFFEKKSPAFTRNLEHLLIGPLWIFSSLIGWKFFDGLQPKN